MEKEKIRASIHFRCMRPHGFLVSVLQPTGCKHSMEEDLVQLKTERVVPL